MKSLLIISRLRCGSCSNRFPSPYLPGWSLPWFRHYAFPLPPQLLPGGSKFLPHILMILPRLLLKRCWRISWINHPNPTSGIILLFIFKLWIKPLSTTPAIRTGHFMWFIVVRLFYAIYFAADRRCDEKLGRISAGLTKDKDNNAFPAMLSTRPLCAWLIINL